MRTSSFVVALSIAAAAAVAAEKPVSEDTPPAGPGLARVTKRNFVCMVNDTYMGKEQIPVAVSGKTYYGCCAMCKERLAQVAEVRSAKDPVSGKKVDKATAVIGRASDGAVLYFENAANLATYNERMK